MKYNEKPLISKIYDFDELDKMPKKKLIDYMVRLDMYLKGIAVMYDHKFVNKGKPSAIILNLDRKKES